jgi:hypothetical protein
MEHHSTVVFGGDAKRALDFAEGVLAGRGFDLDGHPGARVSDHELSATYRARVAGGSTVETHVLLRARDGELALDVRVAGIDELQRKLSRTIVVVALVLFVVQGTLGSLLFKTAARIHSVGMAAALVLFFVVLWFATSPRLFRKWERSIVGELERLLTDAAAAGEGA